MVKYENVEKEEELYMIHDDTMCSDPVDMSKYPKEMQEEVKRIEKELGLR